MFRVFFFPPLLLNLFVKYPKNSSTGTADCTRISTWNKIGSGLLPKLKWTPSSTAATTKTQRGNTDSGARTQPNLHALNITWNSHYCLPWNYPHQKPLEWHSPTSPESRQTIESRAPPHLCSLSQGLRCKRNSHIDLWPGMKQYLQSSWRYIVRNNLLKDDSS